MRLRVIACEVLYREISEAAARSTQQVDVEFLEKGLHDYGAAAMRHLKALGTVVHLDLPLPLLQRRLFDLGTRGVVAHGGQTLQDLYQQRQPLYQQYADITIDCTDRRHEEVVEAIIIALG